MYSRSRLGQKAKGAHSEAKRNAMEESMDEGFRAVRVETNKVLAVVAANKDSVNSSFEKLKDESKCKSLRNYCDALSPLNILSAQSSTII